MYKLVLCLRYLRTRYLALLSIVSLMLGVATLIVVNSVMSGFSTKLRDHLRGMLADITINTDRSEGLPGDPEMLMAQIKAIGGEYIEEISPTIELPALLKFDLRDRNYRRVPIMRQVKLVGIDPKRHVNVGGFGKYLMRQHESAIPSFELTPEAKERFESNRRNAESELNPFELPPPSTPKGFMGEKPPGAEGEASVKRSDSGKLPEIEVPLPPEPIVRPQAPDDPGDFLKTPTIPRNVPPPTIAPPKMPQAPPPRVPGIILGFSIGHYRYKQPDGSIEEHTLLHEGDDVLVTTVGSSGEKPVYCSYSVCDYFKSEMSEYDNGVVYVPLEELQRMTGVGDHVNCIQIKLRDQYAHDRDLLNNQLAPKLQALFPNYGGTVRSWEQQQGAVLGAIDIERGILNLLLFMIVGVAGFSVLAIFSMIVSEKYRDIGILKSLGASNRGIMGIFLSYGLLLGVVGSGLGTIFGLLITKYINEIEIFLTKLTGHQIFDRNIYYFDKIPTNVEPMTVLLVNAGAIGTAVMFSVLPAFRAARLHPIRALRFE